MIVQDDVAIIYGIGLFFVMSNVLLVCLFAIGADLEILPLFLLVLAFMVSFLSASLLLCFLMFQRKTK